ILESTYASTTGTHTFDSISGCALARGVFGQLRLSALLAVPSQVARSLGSTGAASPPPVSGARTPQVPCKGVRMPGTSTRRVLYLGFAAPLTSATLDVRAPRDATSLLNTIPAVGIVTSTGALAWPREVVSRTKRGWSVAFAHVQEADGIVVRHERWALSETSSVRGPGGAWAFDGALQEALDGSSWRFTGVYGQLARFARTTPVGRPVWLDPAVPDASVRQISTTQWGTTVDRVVAARPVTVVWSESYLTGWHAQLVARDGGRTSELEVRRHGLVQSVRVPAGSWTLTFSYWPPHLTVGLAGSLVAVFGFVVLGVSVAAGRRRHRAEERWEEPVA
ncbi:MAG: hypothetical protein ACRDV8_02675, partial [Acidimicrobiales bacterium]